MKKLFITPRVNHILTSVILTARQEGGIATSNPDPTNPDEQVSPLAAPTRVTSVTVPTPVMRN